MSDRDDLEAAVLDGDETYADDGPELVIADPDDQRARARVNRALRRLRSIDRRKATVTFLAEDEIARISVWRDDELRRLDAERGWWERGALSWMRQHFAATGEKTVKLPNGTLTARPGRAKVHVELDQEGLRLLAKDHPGFVRDKVEPDKVAIGNAVKPGDVVEDHPHAELFTETEIRTAVDENGEILVGVYVLVPTEKTYAAKPAAEQEL